MLNTYSEVCLTIALTVMRKRLERDDQTNAILPKMWQFKVVSNAAQRRFELCILTHLLCLLPAKKAEGLYTF
jgi:hypothetical protein